MTTLGLLNTNRTAWREAQRLKRVLQDSRVALVRASVFAPGMRSLPFRTRYKALVRMQTQLEGALQDSLLQEAHRAARGEEVGWIPQVIAGGAAILSVFGLQVYKQRQETKEVENRMELYERLMLEGRSAEEAGRMAFGEDGGIGGTLNKLIILAAIGAGALIYLNVKK